MNETDEIKSRLSIEEVISEYINIKKAGSGFTALCPFHNEKSPSFNISPSRGIYKCFGCGESGDIFSFVQKMDGVDFPTALKKLADRVGVIITERKPIDKELKEKQNQEKLKLLGILEEATKFFQINLLQNEKVKKYLKKRGVDEETAKKFKLGFAKNDWHLLQEFLIQKNFSIEDLEKVGLVKKNENGNVYDRFRNRIIFPIFDIDGNVVAFSGRDFSGVKDTAKYLNSPETLFYDKSNILYGLNFAKTEGRKRGYFILVEGQMDLIMSHKVGFENTIATSGTSLTEKHLKNLGRFSKNLIFAFDSDSAGIEASFRGFKMALKEDFDVKILDIPKGLDPADMILEDEIKWKQIVTDSKNIIDFFINKISLSNNNIKQKNKEMQEKIYPFLIEIQSPIEKGAYVSKVCQAFDVEKAEVLDELKVLEKKRTREINISLKEKIQNDVINKTEKKLDIFSKNNIINQIKKRILKHLTAIYFWQKSLEKNNWDINLDIILKKIEEFSNKDFLNKILALDKSYVDELVIEVESVYNQKNKESLIFDLESDYIRLKENSLKEEIANLQKEFSNAESDDKKQSILGEIQKLNNKIKDAS